MLYLTTLAAMKLHPLLPLSVGFVLLFLIAKLVFAAYRMQQEDIEREFRMSGGHWHHGELSLDQFLMLRPVPRSAQYRTPVDGLYFCGAGAHPGGGVMGSAGRNAARAVLGTR